MRSLRSLPLAAGMAVALAAATAALAGAEFSDPKGDSGGAPDIEVVQAGNDVVAGPVVLWVKLANRMSVDGDDFFYFFLDSDLNRATGSPSGAEHGIVVAGDGNVQLFRWVGADYEQAAAPSLEASFFESGWLLVRIQPADLGGTQAFNFYVLSARGEEEDVAPDGDGVWTYSLVSGPPRLAVERFALVPKVVRAGRPLTATMTVWREDVMDVLAQGKVTCALKVKGKAVRARSAHFGPNGATCRFAVPPRTRGARYTLTVTAAFGGSKATRTVSGTVR